MRKTFLLAVLASLFSTCPLHAQADKEGATMLFQFDPLEVSIPRRKIEDQYRIDPRVNAILLRLLKDKDLRPEGTDSSVENLKKLTTQNGYKLTVRYTELSFLLLEGLAGVKDAQLQNALADVAGPREQNPQLRASALVALAHTKDERFLGEAQNAMSDPSFTVRLGGLESLLLFESNSARDGVAQASRGDVSIVLKVIAAAEDWRRSGVGFEFSRQLLRDYAANADWFVRALAVRYVGEMGKGFEYRQLNSQLINETDPIVRAELAGALLQLKKYKDKE